MPFPTLHDGFEDIFLTIKFELEPPTHTFSKNYAHEGKPLLRIMLELVDGKLEIKTIRFRKRN